MRVRCPLPCARNHSTTSLSRRRWTEVFPQGTTTRADFQNSAPSDSASGAALLVRSSPRARRAPISLGECLTIVDFPFILNRFLGLAFRALMRRIRFSPRQQSCTQMWTQIKPMTGFIACPDLWEFSRDAHCTRQTHESIVLRTSRREETRIAQGETLGEYSAKEHPPRRGGARRKRRDRSTIAEGNFAPPLRGGFSSFCILPRVPLALHPGLFSTTPYGSIPKFFVHAITPRAPQAAEPAASAPMICLKAAEITQLRSPNQVRSLEPMPSLNDLEFAYAPVRSQVRDLREYL